MVKALGNQKTGFNQFLDWFLVCTGFNLFYTSLSANILQLSISNFVTIHFSFKISPRTLIYIKNWCFYKISLVHILFSTVFYIFNHISVNFEPITRPGIEPRTFWTYTRCSNWAIQPWSPVRMDSGLVWDFLAIASKYMAWSGKQMWPV